MADNLESFFKKHLTDETSGGDDWNMPSDSVWENALPQIQKKSGVFIPWKYLYILGLISIVGFTILLFLWNFRSTIPTTNNDITELTTDNSNQDQASNTIIISDSIEKKDNVQNEIAENNNDVYESKKQIEKLLIEPDKKILAENSVKNVVPETKPNTLIIKEKTEKTSSEKKNNSKHKCAR